MRIEQIMARDVQFCRSDDTLDRAAQKMWEFDCGCLPVCNAGGSLKLTAVITDRDIAMCALLQGKALHELRVSEAMSKSLHVCHPHATLANAEQIMRQTQVRRLPVVDDQGYLLGMISLADLACHAAREHGQRTREASESAVGDTLAAICEPAHPRLAA